jgi:hypothetical protein
MYKKLIEFKKQYNHCRASQYSKQDYLLGRWVNGQRILYREKRLSAERMKLLDDIEFDWDPINNQWQTAYDRLVKFKEKNGHCNASEHSTLREECLLAGWIGYQRENYKKGKLGEKQIVLLKSVGVTLDPLNNQWEEMYKKLVDGEKSKKLTFWKIGQRVLYKENKLSGERVKLLKDAGFDWDPMDNFWQKMYNVLIEFNKNPHKKQNISLKKWRDKQRKYYRKKELSDEKIKLLEDIDFDWEPRINGWQKMYTQLKQFKENHNHFNIPYKQDNALFKWIDTQRQSYKKGKLSLDKIQMLQSIGFQWAVKKQLTPISQNIKAIND